MSRTQKRVPEYLAPGDLVCIKPEYRSVFEGSCSRTDRLFRVTGHPTETTITVEGIDAIPPGGNQPGWWQGMFQKAGVKTENEEPPKPPITRSISEGVRMEQEEGLGAVEPGAPPGRAFQRFTDPQVPRPKYPDGNPKTALGMAKPPTRAIPPVAILELGAAMAIGEAKYGRFNWRQKEITASVYTDAISRHLAAYIDGEDRAPDSGVRHLAHIMACCAILIDAEEARVLNDDRHPGPAPRYLVDKETK